MQRLNEGPQDLFKSHSLSDLFINDQYNRIEVYLIELKLI